METGGLAPRFITAYLFRAMIAELDSVALTVNLPEQRGPTPHLNAA